jgi:hypothetical protein
MEGGVGLVAGAVVLPEVGLAGIARSVIVMSALNGAADVPETVVTGEAMNQEVLSQMYDYVIDTFEPIPPPPSAPVPMAPAALPLVVPVDTSSPCRH